jgi:hypothetical protein
VPAAADEPKQAARGDTVVYVSVAAEERIAVYRMDRAAGGLTHRGVARLDGEPGALAVDPGRRFLFAALGPVPLPGEVAQGLRLWLVPTTPAELSPEAQGLLERSLQATADPACRAALEQALGGLRRA